MSELTGHASASGHEPQKSAATQPARAEEEATGATIEARPAASEADLPWYLQVGGPVTSSTNPFAERQRLPDLPPSPPPILHALLSHVSVELGMDDLSLLDLRGLDPPAALGANLLMIVGTARSEKHLHVSADRLCRWLRTEHSLSPFADGLLGRNELKLRMKRKAKRSKLLSSVGARSTGAGEVDDGIRTGWICVNVGQVEGGILAPGEDSDEDFVGFRTEEIGCNIIVQMMTDEKRGALDLESLWTSMLNRSNTRKDEATADTGDRPEKTRKDFDSPFPEARTITA